MQAAQVMQIQCRAIQSLWCPEFCILKHLNLVRETICYFCSPALTMEKPAQRCARCRVFGTLPSKCKHQRNPNQNHQESQKSLPENRSRTVLAPVLLPKMVRGGSQMKVKIAPNEHRNCFQMHPKIACISNDVVYDFEAASTPRESTGAISFCAELMEKVYKKTYKTYNGDFPVLECIPTLFWGHFGTPNGTKNH